MGKKVFLVKVEVIETKKQEKSYFIEADDYDHAVKEVNEYIVGGKDVFKKNWKNSNADIEFNVQSITSPFNYVYQTDAWRDLEEDYIERRQYAESIKDDEEEGEFYLGYLEDAEFFLELAKLLHANKFKEAYKFYREADTAIRESVPERVDKLFEILRVYE